MVSLDVTGAISTAWEYAKKHGLIIAGVLLLLSLVSSSMQSLFGGPSLSNDEARQLGEEIGRGNMQALAEFGKVMSQGIGASIISFIFSIITCIVSFALYNLCLGLMSGRFSECSFDAFKMDPMTYVKAFVIEMITGTIMVIAFLLCVIPFFFVAPRLIMAPLYQIDHPEAGIMDSIKASWNMSSGNTMSLLGLGFICCGIAIVGFFCCCVGVYFAQAIEYFALCAAYYQLKSNVN